MSPRPSRVYQKIRAEAIQAQLDDCQAELALDWEEYRKAVEPVEELAGQPDASPNDSRGEESQPMLVEEAA